MERILKESEDRTGYAVVFFDIKNFKAVNELFGTEIGDMMLRKVYEDVRKSELKPLVSAREDADHFICLVERKNLDLDMLTGMCQKKLTRGGKTLHLSVKCGIFMLEKKKMSVNGMIDRAKIAQRYITDEFVQSYKIYDSSMKNTYIDKATLAGELEEGIEQGQFKVYFQPVVDAMTGKIASAESLIRWFYRKRDLFRRVYLFLHWRKADIFPNWICMCWIRLMNFRRNVISPIRSQFRYQLICHGWISMMRRS